VKPTGYPGGRLAQW